MNVECPFCSRTNAIVWPQDESLPLVVPLGNRVSERQKEIRVQILDVAKELIGGRLGVIAASREFCKHDARSRSHRPSGWPAILNLSRAVYQRSQKVAVWIRIWFHGLSATSAISDRAICRCDFLPPRSVSACG
jgi:hypothetical protein